MENEKVLKLDTLPDNKIRVFRAREWEDVPLPEEVINSINDDPERIPVTVSIRPMSFIEAETRKRLEAEIRRQNRISDQKAGITREEVEAYVKDWEKVSDIISSDLPEEEKLEKFKEESEKLDRDHAELIRKRDVQDVSNVYEAQDKLRDHSIRVVCENTNNIMMKNGYEQHINANTIECIHPDMFDWVLGEIISRSFLSHGEIVGFR